MTTSAATIRVCLAVLLVTFCVGFCNAQSYNPVAAPSAIVNAGKARFTVLTDRLIRMEYSNESTFNDQATITILNRNLPAPEFRTRTENGLLIISTTCLTLT